MAFRKANTKVAMLVLHRYYISFGSPNQSLQGLRRIKKMAQLSAKIIKEIDEYIQKEGSPYGRWYVGIASDPQNRLFQDHNVSKENGWWIYQKASSDTDARAIEKFFLEQKGTQGGPGGGDSSTCFVYAYRITDHTRE